MTDWIIRQLDWRSLSEGRKGSKFIMRKMLMAATAPSMIGMFNMDNTSLLQKEGYEVHAE